jgi:NADH:ubiquinone oxidoreductase subunit 5 (subunit L)/multisubunit Na+/H+ antiporter MnhA subunit
MSKNGMASGCWQRLCIGVLLVGLSSALLIAFFSHRPGPASGGVRAFTTYRLCDIGLLTSVVLLHHSGGEAVFSLQQNSWFQVAPRADQGLNFILVLLLMLACAGKSALVPFGGWLPRAMEGPTPISALIHAATMVAAGVFLVARLEPLYAQFPAVGTFIAVTHGFHDA